jgi:dTDP-4-amino-4,6-dideoxygalactose transaminase
MFEASGVSEHLIYPATLPACGHSFNQFVVRIEDGRRDDVLKSLQAQQVGCAVYYPKPLHVQKCFEYLGYKPGQFPESERASAESLALPIYAELGAIRQERVVRALAHALDVEQASPIISIPARKAA